MYVCILYIHLKQPITELVEQTVLFKFSDCINTIQHTPIPLYVLGKNSPRWKSIRVFCLSSYITRCFLKVSAIEL